MENLIDIEKVQQFNSLSLASLGDAVHTLYIRKNLINMDLPPNKLHLLASKYCKAAKQCEVFEKIFPSFSDLEKEVALRARNHKSHCAKNASLEQYKKATAFEAVVGFLYLIGNFKRLEEILKKSMEEA